MSKLSDTQLVILSQGAKRKSGVVLPLPKSLKVTDRTAANALKSLIKKGLITERPAKRRDAVWREIGEGRFALEITPKGLAAIGIEPEVTREAVAIDTTVCPPRAGTKQARLVELLGRPKGATLSQLQKDTGWLPHTTRAALTGLRKRGFRLTRETPDDGPSVYRIAEAP